MLEASVHGHGMVYNSRKGPHKRDPRKSASFHFKIVREPGAWRTDAYRLDLLIQHLIASGSHLSAHMLLDVSE